MRSHDSDESHSARLVPSGRDARSARRSDAAPLRGRPDGTRGRLDAASLLALQRSLGNAGVTRIVDGLAGAAPTPQRVSDPTGAENRSPVFDIIGRGGGRPLEPSVRQTMEDHLGSPLGTVRVHVDARSTESVAAKAYTVGEDIVVHPRHFSPSSQSGRQLLAHEAVHIHQQRSGPVAGTPVGGGISLSDPSDRFEREAESAAQSVGALL